jgi:hypothetical protein
MAGLPRNKYDLLPYSTTLSTSSTSELNYTRHRPSKREHIESSDAEDTPSSPPRKYRTRKRREWRDSSDIGYSSDVDEDDGVRRMFEDTVHMLRRATGTVSGGEKMEDMTSSQASQENSISKFNRILSTAIMDGLDSIDFSYSSVLLN